MNKRVLSRAEELEIAICYLARIPIRDISEKYALSRSGVHRVVTRLGIVADRVKRSV